MLAVQYGESIPYHTFRLHATRKGSENTTFQIVFPFGTGGTRRARYIIGVWTFVQS